MERYSKPEKCKPKPHPLGGQTRQAATGKQRENEDKERSWHCFGKSAPPCVVHATARGPNNPTKYLDKAKPCPHKMTQYSCQHFSSKFKGGNYPNIS